MSVPEPGSAPVASTDHELSSSADERFFSWRDWLAFSLAAGLCLAGYLVSIQPSVGLEDSGEFLVAAYHLGVPHPPGYPIWTILAWAWQKLIPFGNIAWRVNLMSVVFGAAAIGLVALVISKTGHVMGQRVGFLQRTSKPAVNLLVLASAVSAALVLAFSPVMWSQSVISEVYAFNAFFLMVTLTLLYRWSFEPERRWRLYLAAFVWGVSLTNHQTLVLLTIAFPAFVWFSDRRLGRDVLVPILAVIAAGTLVLVLKKDSMIHQGVFSGGVVLGVGAGAGIWLFYLCRDARGLLARWPQVLLLYGCVVAGLALYVYMHFSSLTNPPMNWGYCSTWEGFVHHFTRGQYEKVHTNRDLIKFWGQLNMFVDDLRSQFNIGFMVLPCACLFFYRDLDRRDRDWLKFLLVAFLFLGLGFIFLSNPGFEKQKQFTDRVFFLPGHVLYSLWIGYSLILGLGYLLGRFPGAVRAAPALAGLVLLMPLVSVRQNWADNEQGGHYFGYEFGYRMFHPGGGYPDMEPNAILFGGTDPGRFVPTYMIFVESFAPPRAKTRHPDFPQSTSFDRRDVYIITQNALADGTYMNYVRDQYDHGRPTNDSLLERWLGRDEVYPQPSIWIPSERDSQMAFGQYIQDVQRQGDAAGGELTMEGGKVQVTGVGGVMAINAILCRMIFDHNKHKHAFYVEESYVIDWMYPYLEPFGIIYKLNAEPVPTPTQNPEHWAALIERDTKYWDVLYEHLMSDPRFHRDDIAQKTFSKMRSAIGGLYAHHGLVKEAEKAFRQAIALCPDSPEANFRLAQLYLGLGQYEPGRLILENYQHRDPYNTRIRAAIDSIRAAQQHLTVEQALQQIYANDPSNVSVALKLIQFYGANDRNAAMDNMVNVLVTNPELTPRQFLELAQLYAGKNRTDRVLHLLTAVTQRYPDESLGWFNLSAFYATMGNCDRAVTYLQQALELDQRGVIVPSLPRDTRFDGCRSHAGFQRFLDPQSVFDSLPLVPQDPPAK